MVNSGYFYLMLPLLKWVASYICCSVLVMTKISVWLYQLRIIEVIFKKNSLDKNAVNESYSVNKTWREIGWYQGYKIEVKKKRLLDTRGKTCHIWVFLPIGLFCGICATQCIILTSLQIMGKDNFKSVTMA